METGSDSTCVYTVATLREAGKISTWHDLELEAGTEWEPAILHKLDTADIILLLISSSFIASKYCYGTELKRAIAWHDAGTARVIPIILRPCDWNHSYVPFSKLNVLPTHAKPITQWEDRDEAFAIVAQRIRETVDQLNAQKQAKQQERQAERSKRDTEAGILMPQYASPADIATLKNDAYRAERKQDWDLAQQLWIQVLAAASGQDMEAIEALQKLAVQRHTRTAMNKTQLDILQAAIDAEETSPSIAITEHHIAERAALSLHEIRANLRLMERRNCVQLQDLSTFNREAVWVKITPEGYMALQGRNEFLN